MTTIRPITLVLVLLALLVPRAVAAQRQQPAPLQTFIAGVARLWMNGDADGIVALAPRDGRIVLDLAGEGPGEVQVRNAAAALRRVFGDHTTVSLRATQVAISGGSPLRGFGELAWVARPDGVTETRPAIVYVGAVWENDAWHLRELRVMR